MKKIKCFVFFVLSVCFVSPLSAVAENFSSIVNKISGQVMVLSDVMTIPDSPLSSGFIFIIPEERLSFLSAEINMPVISKAFPRRRFSMNQDLYDRFVVAFSPLSPDGKYSFSIVEGDYAVCLSLQENLVFPIYMEGCVETEVKNGRNQLPKIFWGLGGVTK